MPVLTNLEVIVVRWAAERLGFDARALRMERLLTAAHEQIRRLGSAEAFGAALDARERTVEDALVDVTTVGETYFFRQHEHFELLSEMRFSAHGHRTAWSAGCSSGEETYSLAAALRQCLGLRSPDLTVWGTDINVKALEAARRAEYGRWSWRQGDAPEAARQALTLDPATRACVRFARHNLLDAPVFDLEGQDSATASAERFDLIFCRNVLVYFTPLAAQTALGHLRAALKPGGWLVLGNMDLGGQPQGFKRVGQPALCVYEKGVVAPSPVPPPAKLSAAPPMPARAAAPAPVPLDPVEWHRAILAELEVGRAPQALQELQLLVENAPDYLPGLFEHALALRRSGKDPAAAACLRQLLQMAQGRPLDEDVAAPEPLSLEFYVNSAQSFLDSIGGPR